jgi:hypothetical protein
VGHLNDKGCMYDPSIPRLSFKVFMDAPRGAGYGENTVGPNAALVRVIGASR